MAYIQPVTLWIAGTTQTANVFSLRIVNDDLSTFAQLYYQLGSEVQPPDAPDPSITWLQDGNLTCNGQSYQDWNNEPDANAWIYNWAAAQLNLTIVTP